MPINNIPTLIVNINNSIYSLFKLFCNEIIPYIIFLFLNPNIYIIILHITIINTLTLSFFLFPIPFVIKNAIINEIKYIT